MNVDNIRKTIESLRSSTTYDQRVYAHPSYTCSTPGCIAGHACIDAGYSLDTVIEYGSMFVSKCYSKQGGYSRDIEHVAAEWFGIEPDSDEAFEMFDDMVDMDTVELPTAEIAAEMLEEFIETGEVYWGLS